MLIAAASSLPALRERTGADGVELLAFSDVEALRALDAITSRRPSIVALDRLFAATPRGAALINRIKADPSLSASEIRVLSPDPNAAVAILPPAEPAPPPSAPPAPAPAEKPAAAVAPAPETPAAIAGSGLDEHGTRRSPRAAVGGLPEVAIDGAAASLIDLNANGMQVLSQGVLKPNQRVRVTLSDANGTVRVNGTVVWATFEIPSGIGPRYRAGIELSGADAKAFTDHFRQ